MAARLLLAPILAIVPIGCAEHVSLGNGFYLESSNDGFGARSHGIVERVGSRWKLYPLPQSDVNLYKKLRRKDANFVPSLSAKDYHGEEVIGPYQVDGPLIWFGNHYYDGEGERGVGVFGYFDTATRQYQLFRPPEVASWQISALLVEPDAVWLGLDHFGEDISTYPGGLVRWDRSTQQTRHYPLEFVVNRIRRRTPDSPALTLSTQNGYAFFRDGKLQRFKVNEGSNGKKITVPIQLFPPPPTIH